MNTGASNTRDTRGTTPTNAAASADPNASSITANVTTHTADVPNNTANNTTTTATPITQSPTAEAPVLVYNVLVSSAYFDKDLIRDDSVLITHSTSVNKVSIACMHMDGLDLCICIICIVRVFDLFHYNYFS